MYIHKQHKQHKQHKPLISLTQDDINLLIYQLSNAVEETETELKIGNTINETHFQSLENTLDRIIKQNETRH